MNLTKQIQKIVNQSIQQERASMLYTVLGKYGYKLPEDIREEMERWAENEQEHAIEMLTKIRL